VTSVRMNITLPKDLANELDAFASPREKSRFIAESLRDRLSRLRREKLEKDLEAGYRARAQEARSLAKEFENVDLEGWDDNPTR
jgi:metal-responsive CopG/Arc/MetJ family transcriptional regulator